MGLKKHRISQDLSITSEGPSVEIYRKRKQRLYYIIAIFYDSEFLINSVFLLKCCWTCVNVLHFLGVAVACFSNGKIQGFVDNLIFHFSRINNHRAATTCRLKKMNQQIFFIINNRFSKPNCSLSNKRIESSQTVFWTIFGQCLL